MAADPQRQDASSNDLFGRWLAHHEQQATEQGEPGGLDDITADSSPPPRASRRLPTAAVASSALERDPLIGSRVAPPSTFGARRPSAKASEQSGSSSELDREPPPGWEPIVMRSIRKKAEQAEAKQVPKQVDRRSRLQRLKARLVDPAEPEAEVEIPEVPLTPPVARSVPLPVAPKPPLPTRTPGSPSPAAPATRSLEETIRAAVPTIERPVAKHAEPRVDEQPAVEQPVEPHVARHAEPRVEPVAQPVAQPVEQPVEEFATVVRHVEPEEVAPPTPVRAFIAAEPEPHIEAYVEPEPVAIEPRTPEPEPEPEPEPVAESVVVEVEPGPTVFSEPAPVVESPVAVPIEVAPDPVELRSTDTATTDDTETTDDQPRRRTFLSLPRRQAKAPKRRQNRQRTGDAARDQVAAKAHARATSPAPQPLEAAPRVVPPAAAQQSAVAVAAPPEPEVAPLKVSKHDQAATEMPGVYKFAAKRTSRRLLTIALLGGLAGSAYFVRAAVEVKDTPSIGLAAIVVLATVMIWAIRGGASLTTLEVHQGQLEVVQQGGRFIFDLASQYTRFEVHGEPGHRGWKVLFPRRGMAPFTVDASMVDPDDFMRVLRFFRPQLVNH